MVNTYTSGLFYCFENSCICCISSFSQPVYTLESFGKELNNIYGLGATTRDSDIIDLGLVSQVSKHLKKFRTSVTFQSESELYVNQWIFVWLNTCKL